MKNKKKHLELPNHFSETREYSQRWFSRQASPPLSNPKNHAKHLRRQATQIEEAIDNLPTEPLFMNEEASVALVIEGSNEYPPPLTQLDSVRGFTLLNLTKDNQSRTWTAHVRAGKRALREFEKKIDKFLEKDGIVDTNELRRFIAGIKSMQLMDLGEFWVGATDQMPADLQKRVWWEVWLRKIHKPGTKKSRHPEEYLNALKERTGIQLSKTFQDFFHVYIRNVFASPMELQEAIELIPVLQEIRPPGIATAPYIKMSKGEQKEWAEDVINRITVSSEAESVAVTILDGGINWDSPLLRKVTSSNLSVAWDDSWPRRTLRDPPSETEAHGTLQAGVAAFGGDLVPHIISNEDLEISHIVESGRILPEGTEGNPFELYGPITVETAIKLEISYPHRNRVYSLAVSFNPEDWDSQPTLHSTAWSAAIDDAAFPIRVSGRTRLFIIAVGNWRRFGGVSVNPNMNSWDYSGLFQLQSPSEAWNAVSVGAYTVIGDSMASDGFLKAYANRGEVLPISRSSMAWFGNPNAPIKPDIVEEGGNLVYSKKYNQLDVRDELCILTSGHDKVFDTTNATSAATAKVSFQAAKILSAYPDFRPETVRAALIHFAAWTGAMTDYFESLRPTKSKSDAYESVMRRVGYGVPNLEQALHSLPRSTTLVIEDTIQPFDKNMEAKTPGNPRFSPTTVFYKLPIPRQSLERLPDDEEVEMRVTLSYFIEPNPTQHPGRRWRSYASHGLRFDVQNPAETDEQFSSRIGYNRAFEEEEDRYQHNPRRHKGWEYPFITRCRGSVHKDVWKGSPRDLALMGQIAIYPVGGWWKEKYRWAGDRYQNSVPFSVLITLHSDNTDIDFYTEISQLIQVDLQIPQEVEI